MGKGGEEERKDLYWAEAHERQLVQQAVTKRHVRHVRREQEYDTSRFLIAGQFQWAAV